jgi:hypothetical protein
MNRKIEYYCGINTSFGIVNSCSIYSTDMWCTRYYGRGQIKIKDKRSCYGSSGYWDIPRREYKETLFLQISEDVAEKILDTPHDSIQGLSVEIFYQDLELWEKAI